VLEAGKEYQGIFFIDNEGLKDKLFTGILKIETDNFLYVINDKSMPIEIYDYFYNNKTKCNVVKEFCFKGTIGNNKITCSHTWNDKNYENRVVFKSDEIFFGDTYIDATPQVKNGFAVFSEFMFDNKEADNKYFIHVGERHREISISYFRDGKYCGINFGYSEFENIDSFCDLLGVINNFFTLVYYKPSEIKKMFITTTDNQKYQVIVRWMPIDSRNNEQRVTLPEFNIKDLANLIDKWIAYTLKADIACQQYFALQTMNRNTYEQMNLYTLIFCFEGFLNALYDNDFFIPENIHNQIKQKIDFYIENLFSECEVKEMLSGIDDENITSYKNTIKKNYSLAFEGTFRKRIKRFLSAHEELKQYKNSSRYKPEGCDLINGIITYRDVYAHSSNRQENLEVVNAIQNKPGYYTCVVIINYMIRTLLIKDVLGLKDADIPKEGI
jgi:hypothetical protein